MDKYTSLYKTLNFERRELFKFLQGEYDCREVLYPGSSIHITPSLYFPHVVYVDRSEAAAQFFTAETQLPAFINRHKTYQQSAYLHFVQQDYSNPLPLREASFDLLLALFAGGVSASCIRYLKIGGILLTNNHQGDALEASRDDKLQFKASIRFRKGKYGIETEKPDKSLSIISQPTSRYMKTSKRGIEYVENEHYYVFERLNE